MVNVDDGPPFPVEQRCEFMHPETVVTLVVGIQLHGLPAVALQGGLHGSKRAFGNHDVDIADKASSGRRQARRDIGGPLQEDDRHLQGRERAPDPIDFPENGSLMIGGNDGGCEKVILNLFRELFQ